MSPPSLSPRRIAVAGLLSLAVAMGIGRFAFTPLLPMMLADGVITLPAASWLASANYLGYLVGALLCTLQPWLWRRLAPLPAVNGPAMVRTGLAATTLLTLGMAMPWAAAWPLLRFAAGVASALVFVYTSGWCLGQLSRQGLPAMGAVIYTGPGGGIVLSGLAASGMVALGWSAATGWLIFGGLAAALTAVMWPVFSPASDLPAAPPAAAGAVPVPARRDRGEIALLTLAYGLAGFGYIITATFLPVIARQALPGSPWLDLFWPIFGAGVVVGAIIASRLRSAGDLRLRLVACYLVQALGIAVGVWSPSLLGFAAGSLLLGLPFTTITYFAMQEVRRLRPEAPASLMGLLTAMYGVGQIIGPPLAAALLARAPNAGQGFTQSLDIAAMALVAGALLFGGMARLYPVPVPRA
ncbi:MAG: YbfB/YjiJ family MFS transporter [Ramlibacter sp.]|nr:YbfB/YjiJ family MFS transporter [Ramlibacter sp.]